MLSRINAADFIHPRIAREPFAAAGWVFEHKLDGFRALAIVKAGEVRLLSRTGRSLAEHFPEVVRALRSLASDVILNCELVVPDERGHPDFEARSHRACNLLDTSRRLSRMQA